MCVLRECAAGKGDVSTCVYECFRTIIFCVCAVHRPIHFFLNRSVLGARLNISFNRLQTARTRGMNVLDVKH